ncbi:MAG TPA: amidase family protein [Sphingobium sp.]
MGEVALARETSARIDRYAALQPEIRINRRAESTIFDHAAAVDQRVAYGEQLPLAGVPFAIKDNIALAGIPATVDCAQFAYIPDESAYVVAPLMAAGAVPIGKSNLDQFATGPDGRRNSHGVSACVCNHAYVSGGSNPGSAGAVAAGLAPIALGTDRGRFGRVSAAFNNLMDFEPAKGRWSMSGLVSACRSLDSHLGASTNFLNFFNIMAVAVRQVSAPIARALA